MITVFWARYTYLNPGMPLLIDELDRRTEAVRVVDVTKATADDLRTAALQSASIVIDQSIYNAATWVQAGTASIYFIHDLRPRDHYDAALGLLLDADVPKLFALYVDLHDVKNVRLIERLAGRVQAVSWMFEKKPLAVGDVLPRYRDPWLTGAPEVQGLWNRVVDAFPVRVELPFALGLTEFRATSPTHVWDVSVAGAPYQTRVIARASIRAKGLKLAPYRSTSMAASGVGRILRYVLTPERASMMNIALLQRLQRQLMSATPISFVCGSGVAFAVRKFFEAPAMRNAMVAMPCTGFEDLGFVDGEHAVVAAPEDAGREARRLMQNESLASRLATAGHDLVLREHSVVSRADQLIACMQRLERGQLHNAQFLRGRFEIG